MANDTDEYLPWRLFMGRGIQAQTRLGRLKATRAAGLLFALLISDAVAIAEPPAQQPTSEPGASSPAGSEVSILVEQLARRLQALEEHDAKLTEKSARMAEQNARLSRDNAELARQLEQVTAQYHQLNQRLDQLGRGEGLPIPLPVPQPPPTEPKPPAPKPVPYSGTAANGFSQPGTASNPPVASLPPLSRFLVGAYDEDRGQFVLVRPRDEQRVPFELRADFFTQARYTNFARSTGSWIDSTGARLPVQSFDSVEINRNFIQFSGFAIDPRLQFTAFIFSSTALNDTVYLGWINYRFSKAFDLRVGNWAVPGTREWYESFRYTLGADRLMATTFFRPNISPGIWAQGEPIENVHYVAMLANSLNRFTRVSTGRIIGRLRRDASGGSRRATLAPGRRTSRITRCRAHGSAPTLPSRERRTRASDAVRAEQPRGHHLAALERYAPVPSRCAGAGRRAHFDGRAALDDRCRCQVPRPEHLGRILLPMARQLQASPEPGAVPLPLR